MSLFKYNLSPQFQTKAFVANLQSRFYLKTVQEILDFHNMYLMGGEL